MHTTTAIYKILEILEKSLDNENFDLEQVNYKSIGISKYKWNKLIEILLYEEFIIGFEKYQDMSMKSPEYEIVDPNITFKGILYLAENTNTAKIISAAKLLKDVIPGI